jgi:mannose-6-phosphate isomerase-like protein (cupin superfamily)
MPYIVRSIQNAKTKQITCGLLSELTDDKDFKGMGISHIKIKDSTRKHRHKKLTEIYYVLKGSIDVEIDNKKIEHLKEGQMIMIFPKTTHKAWKTSKEDAELLVVCCPPWSENDEFLTSD